MCFTTVQRKTTKNFDGSDIQVSLKGAKDDGEDEEEDIDETLELLENFTVSDGKYLKNLWQFLE